MKSKDIRQQFLDFFEEKGHKIVPSAPIVVKNDPTLMFTNAGMNQFKDYFLGHETPDVKRIADTQKCLRVSGKHNDLEEVGVDTYHHTMFEMLGNWSFGDYFKRDAIAWAWELLTETYQIPKDQIYVTIFEGDEQVAEDAEAYQEWLKYIAEERIIRASKKDNFWEMGDTGPCGPCSEIHVDIRSEEERAKGDGKKWVNQDHPQVVEIWNLVFIQYNRKADGSLELLPDKHVDTGMGFERLCMVLQGKQSNYDTDVFMPLIGKLEEISGLRYGREEKTDIAMRVVADHIRAVTFAIVDGQQPSNTGAGYVIRRILRRAVRYSYTFLQQKEATLYKLIPVLVEQFGTVFQGLTENQKNISKQIQEEENAFLRTLDKGLRLFKDVQAQLAETAKTEIDGQTAFKLYDTYGFPIDLTRLIASENGLTVEETGFQQAMKKQREKARAAGKIDAGDWIMLTEDTDIDFVGYDTLVTDAQIVKYRKVTRKKKTLFQIVLDKTPFYAESGGQVGDTGHLQFGEERIEVIDTKRENNLIIHFVKKLPADLSLPAIAVVGAERRQSTARNHTATHLLHSALRTVLGTHVHQKGSLVHPDYLRFDFSHFSKLEEDELAKVEQIVNQKIMQNILLEELRDVPQQEALDMGAMALFGEKYGDTVRVIVFDRDFSVELCGGTHVSATGEIGWCKLTMETSIAAGIRRIEALTGPAAYRHITGEMAALKAVKQIFKNPKDIYKAVSAVVAENNQLKKELERMQMQRAGEIKNSLKDDITQINCLNFIGKKIEAANADMVKKIAFDLRNEVNDLFLVLGAEINGKAHLTLMFDQELVTAKQLNAGQIIRTLAKNIQGGGGGQAFYASAGGRKPEGITQAIAEAKTLAENL